MVDKQTINKSILSIIQRIGYGGASFEVVGFSEINKIAIKCYWDSPTPSYKW